MNRRLIALIALLFLLLASIPIHLSIGAYEISFVDVMKTLLRVGSPSDATSIIAQLRLRRLLSAILAGVALGVAGASMQAALRNHLASPFTLGISHAAALGVAIALLLLGVGGSVSRWFITVENPYVLALFALISALIQLALIMALAYIAGLTERAIILAAIAMSFFYGALVNLLQYLRFNEIQLSMIVFWLFGDVSRPSWLELELITPIVLGLAVYLTLRAISLDLDLLSIGDEVALASGLDPRRARVEIAVAATIEAAIITAFMGVLAFICLIAPHIARLIVGSSYRYVLPASALTGAVLVVMADAIGRLVISPATIPVGVVGSILGAPLLLILLLGRGVMRSHE